MQSKLNKVQIAVITAEPAIQYSYRVNTMLVISFISHLHAAVITAIEINKFEIKKKTREKRK